MSTAHLAPAGKIPEQYDRADHGKLKRLINPVRGFKSMKTAYATLKGVELMRMFRKEQLDAWK